MITIRKLNEERISHLTWFLLDEILLRKSFLTATFSLAQIISHSHLKQKRSEKCFEVKTFQNIQNFQILHFIYITLVQSQNENSNYFLLRESKMLFISSLCWLNSGNDEILFRAAVCNISKLSPFVRANSTIFWSFSFLSLARHILVATRRASISLLITPLIHWRDSKLFIETTISWATSILFSLVSRFQNLKETCFINNLRYVKFAFTSFYQNNRMFVCLCVSSLHPQQARP